MFSYLRCRFLLRLVKILDTVLIAIPFAVYWYKCYSGELSGLLFAKEKWLIVFLFWVLYIALGRTYDAFLISLNHISEMIYSQILAIFISDSILFVVIWVLTGSLPIMLSGVGMLASQIALAVIWAYLAQRWYFGVYPPKKSVVIYNTRKDLERLIEVYGMEKKFRIQFTLPVEECLDKLCLLKDLDAVFLTDIHSHERNIILKYCVENHIEIYMIPRTGDVLISSARRLHLFRLPMLKLGRYNPSLEYLIGKRLFDLLVAGFAVIILSPVMVATALGIKIYDHGPVLYRQIRLTRNGKEFSILKFRSMRVNAEEDGIPRLSTGESDSRVTPVGKIIRKFHIDELPQLLNVIAGSMSIVGPRPERPELAAEYEKELPEFRLRLQVKAGLTGYAQVYGGYDTAPYDKLQMDLMYIGGCGFLEDLKICFATLKILFLPEKKREQEFASYGYK